MSDVKSDWGGAPARFSVVGLGLTTRLAVAVVVAAAVWVMVLAVISA